MAVESAATDAAKPAAGERPTGVLAADLVGYSGLVARDMHGAVELLRTTRSLIVGAVTDSGGSVVQTPGDFVLALFSDPAEMLRAAFEAQARLYRYHSGRGDFSSGHWKIGLALGEVHAIDGDYYGNAINIASRLQGMAAAGEVWFTRKVSLLCARPDEGRVRALGRRLLKNISETLFILCLDLPSYAMELEGARPGTVAPTKLGESTRKPVLQIRPFKHIGSGELGSFMCEALIEELSLILSRLSGSITVGFESTELSPDYMLSGTVQSVKERIRITAKLTGADGQAIWAEKFESDLRDSFDVQDQIARDIVSALQLVLTEGEQAQLWRRGTSSGEAWEAFQRGHDLARRYTREGHRKAMIFYDKALAIDPNYLCAIVALGFCHLDELRLGWSENDRESLSRAAELSERARAIAADHPDALALQAYIAFFRGDELSARASMRQAVLLSPQSSEIIAFEGALLDLMGDFSSAVDAYTRAISLSPFSAAWIAANLALSLLALGEDREAERVFRSVIRNHGDYVRAWIGLTAALVRQGRTQDARDSARVLMDLDPDFSIDAWTRSKPFSDAAILDRFARDLRAAGLP
jgi:class 3 adenylate cyclase/TolB-like protein/Tfp pilus assembly protein PilF